MLLGELSCSSVPGDPLTYQAGRVLGIEGLEHACVFVGHRWGQTHSIRVLRNSGASEFFRGKPQGNRPILALARRLRHASVLCELAAGLFFVPSDKRNRGRQPPDSQNPSKYCEYVRQGQSE
jgi:hypothetical protein